VVSLILTVVVGILLAWLALAATLALAARGQGGVAKEAVRLLPDLVRLVKRLATDGAVPLRARAAVWAAIAYVAFPLDVVPDVVPLVGFTDDVLVVVLALRSVVRHSGASVLAERWPGSDDGLLVLWRVLGSDRR